MLTESSYTIRLEYMQGGNFYADFLVFQSVVGIERMSWGAIKSMYRD
jgi:hypothetical protein